MKRFLIPLIFLPAVSHGSAFDVFINQRNIADSATLLRTMPLPVLNAGSVLGIDPNTNLPRFYELGTSANFINDKFECGPEWMAVLNKPVFSAVATSGNYNDLTNKPTFSQVNADWLAVSGPGEVLNKPVLFSGAYADLSGKPSLSTVATSGAYADLSGKPSIPAAQVQSDWNAVSGIGVILNKPTMTGGTVTSIAAGSGLSGGTITTSGTISLPNVGSAGSYNTVTTDAQGRVSSGSMRSQSSATRTLNTTFQVSATRDAVVQYAVQTTITASIAGGQDADVFLDIASDSGFTTNVQSLDVAPCSQTYTLAIALQGVQKCAAQVRGFVPAGYYARIRTVSNTGAPAFAYRLGQEVLQ